MIPLVVDFLSVRKIPLREREKFSPEGSTSFDDEDPDIEIYLRKVRDIVLKDRDLHDKVRISIFNMFGIYLLVFTGSESLRILRTRLLEARGSVHLPDTNARSHRSGEIFRITTTS